MKIKVSEIKSDLTLNDFEKKLFDVIVDFNDDDEITKKDLEERLSYVEEEVYDVIGSNNLIDLYTDSLFQWYANDVNRIYYLESVSFASHNIIEILQEGQKEYWREELEEMLDKLKNYLVEWE